MSDIVIVRSLSREYRIRTSSSELAAVLAFIQAEPEIAGSTLLPVEIAAAPLDEGFELQLPQGKISVRSVMEAANRIYALIFTGLQEEAQGAPLVHGASLLHNGRRVIVVGPKGAGKSTLTLHLLSREFAIEGDEHVVVGEENVIARPRRMRVKPGSLPLVPRLASAVVRSPSLEALGTRIYAVDPSIAGRPWRISPGQVDHLAFIEPNHGRRSEVQSLGVDEAFRRLAEHCLLPNAQQAAASARLRTLARTVRSWRLSLGDLREAEAAMTACLAC